jgi:hypothetical protein
MAIRTENGEVTRYLLPAAVVCPVVNVKLTAAGVTELNNFEVSELTAE